MPKLMRIDAQPLKAGSNGARLRSHSTHWYEYDVGGTTNQGERIRFDFRFWNGQAGSFMNMVNFSIHRRHEIENWPLGDPCPANLGAGGETGIPGDYFDTPGAARGGKIWKGELERGLEVCVRVYNTSDFLFEYDLVATIEDAAPA